MSGKERMIGKLIKDHAFAEMMNEHAEDVLEFLVEEGVEFGILCNLSEVSFDPPLPEEVAAGLKPLTLFVLAGFTFESARIDFEQRELIFEAGFGPENFGSVVSVPVGAVIQISIEDTVIFINLTASVQKPRRYHRVEKGADVEHSLRTFLTRW